MYDAQRNMLQYLACAKLGLPPTGIALTVSEGSQLELLHFL